MKTHKHIKTFAAILSFAILFSNCNKNTALPGNIIQQGNTTIEINAISPRDASGGSMLQVRYNNVIDAAINATITFHLKDGQQKKIAIKIPAGYKNLTSWVNGGYMNIWDYQGHYDSTGNGSIPVIDYSWDVSSVEITSVTSPDKEYGFKVLTGNDQWTSYQPKDSLTTISFISNKDTIFYSGYDFETSANNLYTTAISSYGFYFFNSKILLFSGNEKYPLSEGMNINIPLMVYHWNSRNYGSQPNGEEAASNGSTLQLTITKLTSIHFDATFSGKLWSSRQPDTLRISHGEIKNALLPKVN